MLLKLISFLSCFWIALNLSGQQAWTVSAEFGLTNFDQNDQLGNPTFLTDPLPGGAIGLNYSRAINSKLNAFVGISYLNFNARTIHTQSGWSTWNGNEIVIKRRTTDHYAISYLTVPFGLTYQVKRWSFGLGSQFGVRLFDVVQTNTETSSLTYAYNGTSSNKTSRNEVDSRFDIGPRLSVAYHINPKFDLGLNFYSGIVTVENNGPRKQNSSVFISLNYRINSTFEYPDYKSIRAEKKTERLANHTEKLEKGKKESKEWKNPFLVSANLDFGVTFTPDYQFFDKPDANIEKLLLTPAIGFTVSNNKGQRLFFETGVNYRSPGKRTFSEIKSGNSHAKFNDKIYWHLVQLPFSIGVNLKSFNLNLGFSASKSAYDREVNDYFYSYSGGQTVEKDYSREVNTSETAGENQYGPFLKFGYSIANRLTLNLNTQFNIQEANKNVHTSFGTAYQLKK